MSDIVERLRDPTIYRMSTMQAEREEAADEIESLRAHAEQLSSDYDVLAMANAKLRNHAEELQNRWRKDLDDAVLKNLDKHGPVYAAIENTWGPRCSDYEPGCVCCQAWKEFDDGKSAFKVRKNDSNAAPS